MTNGNTRFQDEKLLESNNAILVFGIFALGAYWAWIFTTFSSVAINPFGDDGISLYCVLPVIFAGSSALSMLVACLMPEAAESFFKGMRGCVILAIFSCLSCIPALLSSVDVHIPFWLTAALWVLSGCASSFVLLKTTRFLVWLKRAKISRCISLSFLIAALLYAAPQALMAPTRIIGVMLFPVLACIFTFAAGRMIDATTETSSHKHANPNTHLESLKARFSELKSFMPLTLIYTVSFGAVSYAVLYLACVDHMIFVIVLSILFSAAFLAACTFFFKMRIDVDRFQRVLLVLVAIALLPYPYIPATLRVVFLSLAVFGFTCFDALGWGDLADEVRDRRLGMFRYPSTATFINFLGIFLGWGLGFVLFITLGPEGFDKGFGIVSVILVIIMVLYLTLVHDGNGSEAGIANATQFQDAWRQRCAEVSEQHKLTKQEERILLMLARGRSYGYIADELYISTHTVKTHIYHIYRKLDVHSQQELIDLVEEGMS